MESKLKDSDSCTHLYLCVVSVLQGGGVVTELAAQVGRHEQDVPPELRMVC